MCYNYRIGFVRKNTVLHWHNICTEPLRLRSSNKKLLLSTHTCAHFVSEAARENSGAAGKNARPQTHRTLRYTNAHLFRARPCNRSVYVTEKAVRLPRYYELRANVTESTSLRLVRDSLFRARSEVSSLSSSRAFRITREI